MNFKSSKCGETPFSKGSTKLCAALCVNTCPELIANEESRDTLVKEQTTQVLNQTSEAINTATASLNNATKILFYTGSIRFELNKDVLFNDVLAAAAEMAASKITSAGKEVFEFVSFASPVQLPLVKNESIQYWCLYGS